MIILNKDIPENLVSKIVSDIKNKPELKNIDEDFVKDILQKELAKNSKLLEFVIKHDIKNVDRSEKYKNLIKSVRAVLRRSYGVFQTHESKKLDELMLNLKNAVDAAHNPMKTIEEHKAVLKTHLSTKERLEAYPKLYWAIWSITGKPRKIIDLASGLNPLSFPWMGLNNVDYLATELNKADCDSLNEYFGIMKKFQLFGLAIQLDLQHVLKKPEILKSLPHSDVCFIFKVLDTVKLGKSRKIDELIITTVPARWLVVSFPTRSIGGKKKLPNKYIWIEKMCERLNYKFKRLLLGNESFYIINKQTEKV